MLRSVPNRQRVEPSDRSIRRPPVGNAVTAAGIGQVPRSSVYAAAGPDTGRRPLRQVLSASLHEASQKRDQRWPAQRCCEAPRRRRWLALPRLSNGAASGPPGVRRSLPPEAAVQRYPAACGSVCCCQVVGEGRAASWAPRWRTLRAPTVTRVSRSHRAGSHPGGGGRGTERDELRWAYGVPPLLAADLLRRPVGSARVRESRRAEHANPHAPHSSKGPHAWVQEPRTPTRRARRVLGARG